MWTVIGKYPLKNLYDEPVRKEYRKLQVDAMPVVETFEKLNYTELLKEYLTKHGKPLKPINRHKSSLPVANNIVCPKCGAPHSYIYRNNGKSKNVQYLCKVCEFVFGDKTDYFKNAAIRCPHCNKVLERIKERKHFYIFKCKNNNCSFYLSNLRNLTPQEREQYDANPQDFKLHYIYREFTIDFKPLSKETPVMPNVDLSKIHSSPHVLGLVLSYYVNYGMSSRLVQSIMRDIHGVKISHQSVINYANAAATLLKPFVDNYDYPLTNSICGDETYIKVNGKWHYVFFVIDTVKKIITSHHVSPNRDTVAAIKAIDDTLSKYKQIPENLNLVFDGNPIYLLAQHYFARHGIYFDVTQVIGLTNDDPVSEAYRPLKQVVERLNRTLRRYYRTTNGFSAFNNCQNYLTLFTTWYNFLRPHKTLKYQVPVDIHEVTKLPNMPARWIEMLNMAQEYILKHQAA
jgi:transposase-like protein/DNA-directed RNA polymerase subunit RPC12/RpoP